MSGPTPRLHRAFDLPAALHLTRPRRSFGPVLAWIIVAVIFQLAVSDSEVTRLISVLIQGTVIILAVRAAGGEHHLIAATAVLVGVFSIAATIALFVPGEPAIVAPRVLTLVLILLTPTAVIAGVIRELREDGQVTIQTLVCGVCIYLLLGMAFASLFGAIQDISNENFFNNGIPGTPNDYLYFSLATLTTTGYGDFSAATELGRAVSVTEALIGQIYLVTVLAVIVGNVSRRRTDPS